MLYLVHHAMNKVRTHKISGEIGTDCTGSCKSTYHTITTTTVPNSEKTEQYIGIGIVLCSVSLETDNILTYFTSKLENFIV